MMRHQTHHLPPTSTSTFFFARRASATAPEMSAAASLGGSYSVTGTYFAGFFARSSFADAADGAAMKREATAKAARVRLCKGVGCFFNTSTPSKQNLERI